MNNISKLYQDFIKKPIDTKLIKKEIDNLILLEKNFNDNIIDLKSKCSKNDNRIKELLILVDKKNIEINIFKNDLEEYVQRNGNLVDRFLYHSMKIPILEYVVYLVIAIPYLFLQVLLTSIKEDTFFPDRYLTKDQILHRNELFGQLVLLTDEITSLKDQNNQNNDDISQLDHKLVSLSHLVFIKEKLIYSSINDNQKKLYYIKLKKDGKYLYKIGITKYDVAMRYSQDSLSSNIIDILFEVSIDEAEVLEEKIIEHNKLFKLFKHINYTKNEKVLDSGNTEVFTENILSLEFLERKEKIVIKKRIFDINDGEPF